MNLDLYLWMISAGSSYKYEIGRNIWCRNKLKMDQSQWLKYYIILYFIITIHYYNINLEFLEII